MNNFTFCSIDYNNFSAKKYARKVSTKSWVIAFADKLAKYKDRLTTADCDKDRIISGMLHSAFGVNIGDQVFKAMTSDQKTKLVYNIKWSM